jgi:hypothetical protein
MERKAHAPEYKNMEEQRPYSRCRLGGHGLSRADGFLPGFVIPSEENRPG